MIKKLKKKNIFYKEYEIINFINTILEEKKMILKWRNNENVRKWMIDKSIIPLEEHIKYIDLLKYKQDKLCFLIKEDKNYLGIVEFDEITNNSAYFGINSNLNSNIQDIGKILEEISIYLAKKYLNLKKLKLYVYKNNIKATTLYKQSNYNIYNENKKFYFMEKIL